MEIRLIKRGFYTKCRTLVDKSKSFMDKKLNTLSFELGKKIKSTYSTDERIEKHRKAMDAIEAVAPKNVFEPCYYGDTEDNYNYEDDWDDYDYGIGFNYMSDEEYDEANGIEQEPNPEMDARTAEGIRQTNELISQFNQLVEARKAFGIIAEEYRIEYLKDEKENEYD